MKKKPSTDDLRERISRGEQLLRRAQTKLGCREWSRDVTDWHLWLQCNGPELLRLARLGLAAEREHRKG